MFVLMEEAQAQLDRVQTAIDKLKIGEATFDLFLRPLRERKQQLERLIDAYTRMAALKASIETAEAINPDQYATLRHLDPALGSRNNKQILALKALALRVDIDANEKKFIAGFFDES